MENSSQIHDLLRFYSAQLFKAFSLFSLSPTVLQALVGINTFIRSQTTTKHDEIPKLLKTKLPNLIKLLKTKLLKTKTRQLLSISNL